MLVRMSPSTILDVVLRFIVGINYHLLLFIDHALGRLKRKILIYLRLGILLRTSVFDICVFDKEKRLPS